MIRSIAMSSIKFSGLVLAAAAGLLILGVVVLPRSPVDTLPEFNRPTVEVQAEALGLSAEEVEQLVTVPLEQDLLNGVAFLEEIESSSLPGLSSVVMTFEPGTDILDARQVVAERLTQAVGVAGLPDVSKPPQMLQPTSSTGRVAMVRLSSGEQTPIETSVLARWVIAPRLLGVPGVANVSIWGFRDRQLQVLVDPDVLAANDVTLNEIVRTTGNALEVSPLTFLEASAPGTGGWIETVNQRLHIFHEQAINTPDELAQVPIEGTNGAVFVDGQAVTLGDVSQVVEDHQPLIGDAYCSAGDQGCLLLVVEKFPGANTREVAQGVDDALAALAPGLGGLETDTSLYRPADHIDASFDNLGRALLVGAILVALVLLAALPSWRAAVVAAVAIPVALVSAGLVLYAADVTVNMLTVAGLVLGLTVIVVDAVFDVHAVTTRLRRHGAIGEATPTLRMVVDASSRSRRTASFALLVVAAVTVPLLFAEGLAGAFLPPALLSFALAVGASLVVALTLTPALSALLLARTPVGATESRAGRALSTAYERSGARAVRRPTPALAVGAVLLLLGVGSLALVDTSLDPGLEERDVLVHVDAPAGTSLPRMDALMAGIVDDVAAINGVRTVGAHVGRAVTSDQVVNVNRGELWVNVDPAADYQRTVSAIDQAVDGLPDVSHEVLTYSQERVNDVLRRGTAGDLVVRVYGEDPVVLQETAERVRTTVEGIDGVSESVIDHPVEESTVEVEVDIAAAQAHGVKPGDVRRAAAILLSGITAGNLFEEQKVFDVAVWGHPDIRQSEDDIGRLLIDTPAGGHVRLADVAQVRLVDSPAVIRHHSVMSYLDVVSDVPNADVAAVVPAIDAAIDGLDFPLEYHAEVVGADPAMSTATLVTLVVSSAIAVFLLLQAAFGSWRLAALAFAMLPVAVAGAFIAVALTGGQLTLGAVLGLLGVVAIAAFSVIALVRHYQDLQREGQPFGLDLVVRGTSDRLAPVVGSTVALAAVFLPIAVLGSSIGLEIVAPMAVAMLGGLVTTTVVSLVVVPALYLAFGRVDHPDTTAEDLVIRIPSDAEMAGGPSS